MGASVVGFWPGITREQLASQPGFFNDCKSWGDWMAEREGHPELLALHKSLGVEALLSHTTDRMKPSEVAWVAPEQLASAANLLRDLVLAGDPRIQPIIDAYEQGADQDEPTDQQLAQDLLDVAAIASFARQCGVPEMTLEVNW